MPVLTAELVGGIVEGVRTFPTWGVARVYQHLRQQGLAVTEPQVQQAVTQSGWQRLQQTLRTRYDLSGPGLGLREGWLVGQSLGQIRVSRAPGGRPTPAGRSADHAGRPDDAGQRGRHPAASARQDALPWLLRVEQVLLGDWQAVTDGQVRCPACGSDQVGRKSAQPRLKKYYNEYLLTGLHGIDKLW